MRAGRFAGLDEITVPLTFAWPERDRLVGRPRRLPADARSVTLTGCGHLPTWDDPEQVARVLLEGSSPNRIDCVANMTALRPDPHTLLIVVAPTETGSPALIAAWRAGFCPSPAPTTSTGATAAGSRDPGRRSRAEPRSAPFPARR